MSAPRAPRRAVRRAGAVLAGLVAIFALSHATDAALHATGVFPPAGQPMADGLFVLALAYRLAFSVAGCWLTARLAPDRPTRHALALGLLGLVLSTAAMLATWDRGPEFGPRWYPLALVVSAIPCAWAGGRIAEARLRAGSAAGGAAASQTSHA